MNSMNNIRDLLGTVIISDGQQNKIELHFVIRLISPNK